MPARREWPPEGCRRREPVPEGCRRREPVPEGCRRRERARIAGRSQGGTTSLDTTALFCFTHHHVFIHQLGWTITGSPNATLHFTHPGGWLTLDSPLPAQAKPRAP